MYYQFVSVTGRIMGKGIPAVHWDRIANTGFQLVYGSTANLFIDRDGNYIGYGPEARELVGIPEPETFEVLPWDKRTARVFCTLFRGKEEEVDGGAYLTSDCRGNLRRIHGDFERETGATRVELGPMLRDSDVVTLHTPSTPETKGMINAETLARMRPGAILINTARGDLVREAALAIALEEGRLGAAGLDVYADEPAIHPRLRAAPRTVLLPHIGSATHETRRRMAAIAVANVRAVLAGQPPLTPVYR